jgi:TolB-like protein
MGYQGDMEEQAAALARKILKNDIHRVGVEDFGDLDGRVTELGRYLAEELSGALVAAAKGFEVIDRQRMKSLLAEHRLGTTGLLDPETMQKLGKIAGVEALVTGTLTRLSDRVELHLKVLDMETAAILVSSKVEIPETDPIKDLLRKELDTGPLCGGGLAQQRPRPHATEVNGIVFEFQRCDRSRGTVRCSLLATSRDLGRDLALTRATRVLDDTGNEYRASSVRVGAERGKVVKNRLPAGTAVAVEVTIPKVPTRLKRFAMLELDCEAFEVVLREVPVF